MKKWLCLAAEPFYLPVLQELSGRAVFAAAEKRRILRHIVQREDRERQLFKAISRQVAAHQSGRVCRNDRSSARLEERTEMMRRLLKLRVQEDKLQIAGMEALGCAVTPCSFSELFTAMQQGLVDGQENPITNIYFSKFYEVQKYLTLSGHSYGVSVFVINKDYFEKLPAEYQTIISEKAKNSEEFARKKLSEMEGDMLAELEQNGMEITTLTADEQNAFVEAVRPSWSAAEEVMGKEAYEQMLSEVARIEGELGLN